MLLLQTLRSESGNSVAPVQLMLVDLAGNERCDTAGTCGDQLKEGGAVNDSLGVLKLIFKMRREQQGNSQGGK